MTQLDQEQLQLPLHSGLEQPKFAWERFSDFAEELPPLLMRHWQEIALNQDKIKLNFLWASYFKLDTAGILRCLTARVNGTLVGYHFLFVTPDLHYTIMSAQTDMYWIDPAYRDGMTGYKLLRLARDYLQAEGVKWHKITAKRHKPLGKLFKRMGYAPIETVYSKVF